MKAVPLYPGGPYDRQAPATVLIVAEGFLDTERDTFVEHCYDLYERLTELMPFSLLRLDSSAVRFYYLFLESQSRPVSNQPSSDATALETSIDGTSGTVSLPVTSLASLASDISFEAVDGVMTLEEVAARGAEPAGGCEVFVLMPSIGGAGAEGPTPSHLWGTDEIRYVATTMDGLWHQVLARRLASRLGLGDEFDLDGADFAAPASKSDWHRIHEAPNLIYSPDDPPTDLGRHWSHLLSALPSNPPVVRASGSTANRELAGSFRTAPVFELHEGGGGFRQGVYRSSADSMMRRRIGDSSLPVRSQLLPFSPAAEAFLKLVLVSRPS